MHIIVSDDERHNSNSQHSLFQLSTHELITILYCTLCFIFFTMHIFLYSLANLASLKFLYATQPHP
jgi:hypothetical protein